MTNFDSSANGAQVPTTTNHPPDASDRRNGKPHNNGTQPKILTPQFEHIPDELKQLHQWVVWKLEQRPKEDKPTKVPYNPARPQSKARANDSQTWGTYAQALAAYKSGKFRGVGFELMPGMVGLDLDHAMNRETGEVKPWAQEIVEIFTPYAYIEVSPSGTGTRIFVYGELPEDPNRVKGDGSPAYGRATSIHDAPGGNIIGKIEMYGGDRYLTLTGHPLTSGAMKEATKQVTALYRKLFSPKTKPTARGAATVSLSLSDNDLLQKAFAASNGHKIKALYDGDINGYPSASEAHQALACHFAFYTRDAAQIERLWRSSQLSDHHKVARRGDYVQRTINRALETVNESYTGPRSGPHEFRTQGAQAAEKEGFGGFEGKSSQEPPSFPSSPQPLTIELLPVPTLPPAIIPAPLREWLQDIAERMSCPLEYPTVAAIVALSSLAGRSIAIKPKQYDDWAVVPNVWGGIVGDPGDLKTPATDDALKPLHRLAVEAEKQYAADMERYEIELEIAAAQADARKNALKSAAKKGQDREALKKLAERNKLEETISPPTRRRYVINDATVEALGERLKENPRGLLHYRDELSGWWRTLEKQGHESDRAFYLESWNGTAENYAYDRIGRGTIIISAVCLSIFGTIQPGPILRFIRAAGGAEGADGLIQRFQLLVYPDKPQWKHVDRWPNHEAKNRAYAIFKALDSLEPLSIGAQASDSGGIPFLHFAPDAQVFFNQWWAELETTKLRTGHERPVIESHLSKYRSLMPSLALLFHLIDVVDERATGPVSLSAAQSAAAWCDLLEAHARRIYQCALDGEFDSAAALAERIKQGLLPRCFRIQKFVLKGWGSLCTTEDFERAVAFLEDRGWLQAVDNPPGPQGGRPTRDIWIHPSLPAKEEANQ